MQLFKLKTIFIIFVLLMILSVQVTAETDSNESSELTPQSIPIYLLIGSNLAFSDSEVIPIYSETNAVPYIESDRTLVPLRFIAEKLGAEVIWNPIHKGIAIVREDQIMRLRIDSELMTMNDSTIRIDVAPQLKEGRTYVPLRAVFEAFGANVYYDAGIINVSNSNVKPTESDFDKARKWLASGLPYQVYQTDVFLDGFTSFEDAQNFSALWVMSSVRNRDGEWISDNYPPYEVIHENNSLGHFDSFVEAKDFASQAEGSIVVYRRGDTLWGGLSVSAKNAAIQKIEGVPLIPQLPELDRGCEVTSLAMLLGYYGIDVHKMQLAREIDTLPFTVVGSDGKTYRTNPYYGFVGNIYTLDKPGLGVYHRPVAKLAEKYAPNKVADLTGSNFDEVLFQVAEGRPVWVIVTSNYSIVPDSQWMNWKTFQGDVKITYQEHSVVITGYDDEYVYINDPYKISTKVNRNYFRKGWEQIGKQAIVIANAN